MNNLNDTPSVPAGDEQETGSELTDDLETLERWTADLIERVNTDEYAVLDEDVIGRLVGRLRAVETILNESRRFVAFYQGGA